MNFGFFTREPRIPNQLFRFLFRLTFERKIPLAGGVRNDFIPVFTDSPMEANGTLFNQILLRQPLHINDDLRVNYSYSSLDHYTPPGSLQSNLTVASSIGLNSDYQGNLSITFFWVNQRFIVRKNQTINIIATEDYNILPYDAYAFISQKESNSEYVPNLVYIPPNPVEDRNISCQWYLDYVDYKPIDFMLYDYLYEYDTVENNFISLYSYFEKCYFLETNLIDIGIKGYRFQVCFSEGNYNLFNFKRFNFTTRVSLVSIQHF
jgi:hypothetical protein